MKLDNNDDNQGDANDSDSSENDESTSSKQDEEFFLRETKAVMTTTTKEEQRISNGKDDAKEEEEDDDENATIQHPTIELKISLGDYGSGGGVMDLLGGEPAATNEAELVPNDDDDDDDDNDNVFDKDNGSTRKNAAEQLTSNLLLTGKRKRDHASVNTRPKGPLITELS